jgi:hypothetical protein
MLVTSSREGKGNECKVIGERLQKIPHPLSRIYIFIFYEKRFSNHDVSGLRPDASKIVLTCGHRSL